MDSKITKIEIIMNPGRFDELKEALNEIGITGMTVSNVLGCGLQKGHKEYYRGVAVDINLLPKLKVEIVVSEVPVDSVIEVATKVLRTGHIGDGKIFIYEVNDSVRIRTGERGSAAIIDSKYI
jgi:nitrogen regulatory protein P-II 1